MSDDINEAIDAVVEKETAKAKKAKALDELYPPKEEIVEYQAPREISIERRLTVALDGIEPKVEAINKLTKNDGAPGVGAHNTRLMNRFRSLKGEAESFIKFLKDEGYGDA